MENSRYAVDLAGDPCWLVRYVLASNVGKICDNLPDDVLQKNIETVTLSLLHDEEVLRRGGAHRPSTTHSPASPTTTLPSSAVASPS